VAEHGPEPAGKHRGHVVAVDGRGAVADRVDPVVHAQKAPVGKPALDLPAIHALVDELAA